MNELDPLQQIQADFTARLRSRRQLRGLHIQDLRPRSEAESTLIVDGVNQALAGMVTNGVFAGLSLLVPLPTFEVNRKNNTDAFGDVIVTVQVLENVMINEGPNGSRISCEGAAILAMMAGHHFQLRQSMTSVADEMRPLEVDKQDWNADIAWQVQFRVACGFVQEAACPVPQVSFEDYTLTVSTSQAGGVIYLTLDGSLPWSGNPAATALQSGAALDVTSGAVVRAVTTHPELNDSSAFYLVIP